MDPFEYLVVLTSIVLGLAVTRVIAGIGNIIQTRQRKRSYWVHIIWMVNLFLTITIVWWVAYRWRTQTHWTFFLFLWLLLMPTLLYLTSALIYPDTLARAAKAGINAKAMLADNDPWSFFKAIGDLLMTGPTLTNVNDFRAVLVEKG